MNKSSVKKLNTATAAGAAAVLIWAFVPSVKRLLTEGLAMFFSGGISGVFAGLVMLVQHMRRGGMRPLRSISARYWVLCALPHFIYSLANILYAGLAVTREGAIVAGLFASLWPLTTLIFTVLIMKVPVKKVFWAFCALSVVGVILAGAGDGLAALLAALLDNAWAIFFGIVSPVCWGIYSGFYCEIVRDVRDDHVAWLTIVSGVFQLIMSVLVRERIGVIGVTEIGCLVFQCLFSSVLATLLWNYAMRDDSRMASIVFSNFTPVLQVVCSCALLGVKLTWQMLLGAGIIVAATVCAERCMGTGTEADKVINVA